MSFNIKATIGADGSGYLREVSKVARANEALEAKIAQRAFDKLDHQGKLNSLKAQALALSNKSFALEAAGDKGGAARATLAALEKREQAERMVTEEKLRQQKIQDETAKKAETVAEKARRDAEALAREQQRQGERAADQAERAAKEKQRLEERTTEAARRQSEERARQSEREQERLTKIRQQDARFQRDTFDKLDRYRKQRVGEGLRHGPAAAKAGGGLAGLGSDLATGALSGFGAPLGAAAAAGAAIYALKGALNFADQVTDAAEQMGVTTNEFQKMELAATRAGVGIGDFQTALSQIDVQRREAGEGNAELQAQFARFGVTLADINNPALRHLDILKKIAAQTGDMDAAGRGAMKQLLGRRGDRLGGALQEMGQVSENEIVSDTAIARLDSMNQKVEMVGHSLKTWGVEALAFWDSFAENAAKFSYSFIDQGVGTQHAGKTREQSAKFAHQLEANRGMTPEGMTGEAKLYSDFITAQVADMQQGGSGKLDFAKFAAARDEQQAKTLFTNKTNKKLEEDIAEIVAKRAMIGMTNAEKELKLKEEIAALELEMQYAEDDTGRLRLKKAMEEKRSAVAELEAKPGDEAKPEKAAGSSRAPERNVDSLARIGLFVGGVPQGIKAQPLTGPEAARLNAVLAGKLDRIERAARDGKAWA